MSLNVPYAGPGVDDSTDIIRPEAFTLRKQIEKYVSTPAGTQPEPDSPSPIDTQLVPVGILAEGYPFGTALPSAELALIYSSLINNGNTTTLGLYNFTDPNCFPLAAEATTTPTVIPATTTLVDLSSITAQASSANYQHATLYPNTATSGTAAPLSYQKTADGKYVGVVFTDNNATGVAESICIQPWVSGVKQSLGSQLPSTAEDGMWMIAFETPATLSTGTAASLFTIGSALDGTLQVAFGLMSGQFVAYVNGATINFNYGVSPAVSTRYALGIRWRKDPYDKSQYRITLFYAINGGAWDVYDNFEPVPYQATPWTGFVAHPLAQGDAGTTPVSGFGPVAAFGGQWAFTALGYQAEQLSINRTTTEDEATAIFDAFVNSFSFTHAV